MKRRKMSYKTIVFEELFNECWDEASRRLNRSVVTLRDVQRKIQDYNRSSTRAISDRNPANFFKDFVRRIDRANAQWPPSVLERGYTAVQVTGGGKAFEFVPLPQGQTEAFPRLEPGLSQVPHDVQTLSIQPLARQLGRREETWLMQVAAKLNLIETHMALHSKVREQLAHVELLQLGIKQNLAEIDGLYLAHDIHGYGILVPVEAKIRDDIYPSQVYAQVEALKAMRTLQNKRISRIVPLAIKVTAPSRIYIVEFPAIDFDGENVLRQDKCAESTYRLVPHVAGI